MAPGFESPLSKSVDNLAATAEEIQPVLRVSDSGLVRLRRQSFEDPSPVLPDLIREIVQVGDKIFVSFKPYSVSICYLNILFICRPVSQIFLIISSVFVQADKGMVKRRISQFEQKL